MSAKAKKQNVFRAYFNNFGVRQICDLLMVGGAIVLLVGIFVSEIVILVGLGIYIVATILSLFRSVSLMISVKNHKNPEYKTALVNTIIMCIVLCLAVFGFIFGMLRI